MNNEFQRLSDQLAVGHRWFDRNHLQSRQRLLDVLANEQPARRRFAIGRRVAIVTAIAAAILVSWALLLPRATAFEQVAGNIRSAKSYAATFTKQTVADGVTHTLAGKWYWKAPASYRFDLKGRRGTTELDTVQVVSGDTAGILIDHRQKNYRRQSARRGEVPPLILFESLGRFAGKADRDLGVRDVNGERAHGFTISTQKLDPDSPPGVVTIWIADRTKLPLQIQIDAKDSQGRPEITKFDDLQWNIALDPSLFQPATPKGYADATPPAMDAAAVVKTVVVALRTYAKFSNGSYPRVKRIYGDVTGDELARLAGISKPPTKEQVQSDAYVKVLDASRGFAIVSEILRDNPEAEYFGMTVTPKDKTRILLRWQLDDGRHQVIYGDLRSEIVSTAQTRPSTTK